MTQAVSFPNPSSSLPETFSVTITMLSDWHIGSGTGRPGEVDRLIRRDREGFPYIPAKTLTGIWRDACELIATGLDESESGPWQQWVDYLFGDQPALRDRSVEASQFVPRQAALSIRAAHLDNNLKPALSSKPLLLQTLTFIKPGISIDSTSGCAKEDYLRFEEMVRQGTTLQTTCTLNLEELNENQQKAAYVLLIAGSQIIERLGGKRRRGAGKCEVKLQGINLDIIDWLDQNKIPPEPPKPDADKDAIHWQEPQSLTENWTTIALLITTQSPLIIPARTIGNVVETLDYIPGTYLLRLVFQSLRSLNLPLSAAIAHGDILVTNATLQIDGQAGQPTPMALFYAKVDGGLKKGNVFNRLKEKDDGEKQLKGCREGYIGDFEQAQSLGSNPTETYLPKPGEKVTGIETHNTVEDQSQRPTSDVGGVYSYEAIAPNTQFKAELRIRSSIVENLDSEWWTCLDGLHRIGQSKKDDYGLVNIEATKSEPVKQSDSDPASDPASDANSKGTSDRLVVWLLSDMLLRDPRLRPTTSLTHFCQALEDALNEGQEPKISLIESPLTEPTEQEAEEKLKEQDVLQAIVQFNRLDSWQVRWGLPRPSLVGLSAGSCMVFKVIGALSQDRLRQLEQSGMGDRCAEGYGQLRFNPPILMKELAKAQPLDQKSSEQDHESIQSQDNSMNLEIITPYAKILGRAAYREAIRRAAMYIAAHETQRQELFDMTIKEEENEENKILKKGQPTMSQLGGLRSVIGRMRSFSDHTLITAPETGWIARLQNSKYRKNKWSEESIQGIKRLVETEEWIWTQLDQALHDLEYPQQFDKLALSQAHINELKKELWAEAVQTLVGACIRAHKRAIENNFDSSESSNQSASPSA